jgi:hypothetical protein
MVVWMLKKANSFRVFDKMLSKLYAGVTSQSALRQDLKDMTSPDNRWPQHSSDKILSKARKVFASVNILIEWTFEAKILIWRTYQNYQCLKWCRFFIVFACNLRNIDTLVNVVITICVKILANLVIIINNCKVDSYMHARAFKTFPSDVTTYIKEKNTRHFWVAYDRNCIFSPMRIGSKTIDCFPFQSSHY